MLVLFVRDLQAAYEWTGTTTGRYVEEVDVSDDDLPGIPVEEEWRPLLRSTMPVRFCPSQADTTYETQRRGGT